MFTGDTGAGVIVGIIDTGIDFRHHFFMKRLTPTKQTRIRRIWDMGLLQQAGEKQPKPERLGLPAGSPVYGVEYRDTDIDFALNGPSPPLPVRHRDCAGHGTHVAAITAGDGRPAYNLVGMAPLAEIIAVKILYTRNEPPVRFERTFEDAVNYILNVAKDDLGNKPVVINCSFGSSMGPHDGLSASEQFVNTTFNGAASKAIVFAAGNSASDKQHFEAAIPAVGTLPVDFELFDDRAATDFTHRRACDTRNTTSPLFVEIWYPVIAPATVSASVTLPGGGAPVAAPALGGPMALASYGPLSNNRCEVFHNTETDGAVSRNVIRIFLRPNGNSHVTGTYTVTLSASAAQTVQMWCQQTSFKFGLRFTGASPSHDQMLIGSPGGAEHAITVAAFATHSAPANPLKGTPAVAVGDLLFFSSRGPMATYTAAAAPVKPDIAAPGYKIMAAKSLHETANPLTVMQGPGTGTATTAKGGTSMAVPHIAGAVALMLQRNPALTTADIKTLLKTHLRPRPGSGTVAEWGAGKLDAKDAHDNA